MPNININLEGEIFDIKSNTDTTILDAVLSNHIDLPYACQVGMCHTCKCKLLEGEVFSLVEVEEGYILPCRSTPVTNIKIQID